MSASVRRRAIARATTAIASKFLVGGQLPKGTDGVNLSAIKPETTNYSMDHAPILRVY